MLVDIDSLLRPVYGHNKQGASFGHTKIAGRQVLRRGLSPLVTTICTDTGAPVVAGIRLRAGKAGSGRGAASMITEAIATAKAAGATGHILVRGDSAYGNSAVVAACVKAGARFSVVLTKTRAVTAAIDLIAHDAWQPVHYPGAVTDPDTGQLISHAHVAEVPFTAFASTGHPVTARLIVRRVRDQARLDELFPVWRYHPFLTDNTEPTAQADITHRRHAIIETVHSDLIDGPLSGLPSGRFAGQRRLGDLRRASPTTCSAPPAPWPEPTTPSPVARRCADGSSSSRPASPARNDGRSCTYRLTGPGPNPGPTCSTPSSPRPAAHRPRPDHQHPPPRRHDQEPTEKLARPATHPRRRPGPTPTRSTNSGKINTQTDPRIEA